MPRKYSDRTISDVLSMFQVEVKTYQYGVFLNASFNDLYQLCVRSDDSVDASIALNRDETELGIFKIKILRKG